MLADGNRAREDPGDGHRPCLWQRGRRELGDATRRRKNAEEQVDLLREQLRTLATVPDQFSELRRSATSSTTPTAVSAVLQKASKNGPPKPHTINGRIAPIRPFHKVWVLEHSIETDPSSTPSTERERFRPRPSSCNMEQRQVMIRYWDAHFQRRRGEIA